MANKYSMREVESVLNLLYANDGDMKKTAEQTGIPVTVIGMFKRRAMENADIIRIRRGKDFISSSYDFLFWLLRSKDLKDKVKEAPLKEVTDLITKLMNKIEDYHQMLGMTIVDIEQQLTKTEKALISTRKAEELGDFKLIEEEKRSKEVHDLKPETNSSSDDDYDFGETENEDDAEAFVQ